MSERVIQPYGNANFRFAGAVERRRLFAWLRQGALHTGLALFLLLFLTALEYDLRWRGWLPIRGIAVFTVGTAAIIAVVASCTAGFKERFFAHVQTSVRQDWPLWLTLLALANVSYIYLSRTEVQSVDAVFYGLPFLSCAFAALLPLAPQIRSRWPAFLWLSFLAYCLTVWIDIWRPGTFTAIAWRPAGLVRDSNTGAYMIIMLALPLLSYRRFRFRSFAALFLAGTTVFLTLSRGGALVFLVVNLAYIAFALWRFPQRRVFVLANAGRMLAATLVSAWLGLGTLPLFQQEEAKVRIEDVLQVQRWFIYNVSPQSPVIQEVWARYQAFGAIDVDADGTASDPPAKAEVDGETVRAPEPALEAAPEAPGAAEPETRAAPDVGSAASRAALPDRPLEVAPEAGLSEAGAPADAEEATVALPGPSVLPDQVPQGPDVAHDADGTALAPLASAEAVRAPDPALEAAPEAPGAAGPETRAAPDVGSAASRAVVPARPLETAPETGLSETGAPADEEEMTAALPGPSVLPDQIPQGLDIVNENVLDPVRAELPSGKMIISSARINRTRNSLQAIQASPWIGYGTKFNVRSDISPHNIYLGTWIDFGLLGPVLYIAFLCAAGRSFWRYRVWAGLFLTGVIAVWSLFSQTVLGTRALFVLLGLLLGLQYRDGREPANAPPPLS